MNFLIIGLGYFGQGLAKELTNLGHEVIGVDDNERHIEEIKNDISESFILDSTDDNALSILPLNDIDIIIVAIGHDLGSSVKTVSLLKNRNLKAKLYARAFDDIHTLILSALGIKNIMRPEIDAALLYAKRFSQE